MIEIRPRNDAEQPPRPTPRERRLERLRMWRDANRNRLREYQRKWRVEHPERLAIHRQNEYAARKQRRRRLRLRRVAQLRRRATKRAEIMRRYY